MKVHYSRLCGQELHSYTVAIKCHSHCCHNIQWQINKHAELLFSGSGAALSIVIHRSGG